MDAALPISSSVWSRMLARTMSPPARAARVNAMVIAVVLMSLADLYMTLTYATSGGFLEDNPLARVIMQHGSIQAVAAWKLLSIALFAFILHRARHRRIAELASWLCLLTMVWLMLRWIGYTEQVALITPYVSGVRLPDDIRWVTLVN